MSDNPRMEHPDVAAAERTHIIEAHLDIQLDALLSALRDRLAQAFPAMAFSGFRGELTALAGADELLDLLRFAKTDPDVACELLTDVTAVHWLGGTLARQAQETTGWPVYSEERQGRIDVDYILYSITHHHRFRIRVSLPDVDPAIASATAVYASAEPLEREVFDLMGVRFEGHPRLERILMPEDWEGHPLRKDYPLGGVDVQYKGATVPAPDRRQY